MREDALAKRGDKPPTIEEQAKKGDYVLVDPLDYLILGALPDEGELVMGYYPFAKTVQQLAKENLPGMKGSQLVGPIRRLLIQDLIKRVATRNTRENAYQRSMKGKELFEKWEQEQAKRPPDMSGDGKSS